jgi:hypothetical protein
VSAGLRDAEQVTLDWIASLQRDPLFPAFKAALGSDVMRRIRRRYERAAYYSPQEEAAQPIMVTERDIAQHEVRRFLKYWPMYAVFSMAEVPIRENVRNNAYWGRTHMRATSVQGYWPMIVALHPVDEPGRDAPASDATGETE